MRHHHHLRLMSCFLYGVGRAMAFRHSSLISAVSSSIPRSSISSSMHLLQLFFGLRTSLLPGTSILIALPTALSSPLLFTWPNHLNLFLLNLLSMSSRSHLISTSSLGTLSCHLIPAMYLNILLSVVLIISRNPTVKGHVSEPYNRAGLMHASYTLARCLKRNSAVDQEAGYLLPLQPGCRDPPSNCHLFVTITLESLEKKKSIHWTITPPLTLPCLLSAWLNDYTRSLLTTYSTCISYNFFIFVRFV